MRKTKLTQDQIDLIMSAEEKNADILQDLINFRRFCQFKFYVNQMTKIIEDPEGVGDEPEEPIKGSKLKQMLRRLKNEEESTKPAVDILSRIRSRQLDDDEEPEIHNLDKANKVLKKISRKSKHISPKKP